MFILGIKRREFKDQDPANLKAAELVGRLHDSLKAVGYIGGCESFTKQQIYRAMETNINVTETSGIV